MLCIKVNYATRLGNWLFQYAVAKSRAKGGEVAFWTPNADKLEELKKFAEIYPDAKFVTEVPDGAEVIEGLNQDPRLFDEGIVRQSIVRPERISRFIEAKWGMLLHVPNLVSIHVRRGDYLRLPHRHPFVGKKYLQRAVEMMRSLGCEYIVCSDDMTWCKKFFCPDNFPETVFHFIEGGTALSDLFMATYCRCNICSNSTFSWWGAWLNVHADKRVVFPSMWYGPAHGPRDWDCLYFPSSEIIENHYTIGMALRVCWQMAMTNVGNVLRKVRA